MRYSQQLMSMGSSSYQRPQSKGSSHIARYVCGKYHTEPCQECNVCFHCGQLRHFKRECPYLIHSSTGTPEFHKLLDQVLALSNLVVFKGKVHKLNRIVHLLVEHSLH